MAAFYGCSDVVQHLLSRGAGIDIKDIIGWTPLHLAARNGHSNVVQHLLDGGAGVDIKNNVDGETPLHRAAWDGRYNVVQHLLDRGAGIDAKNNGGSTPLQLAEQQKHVDVVALLKAKGGKK